MRTWIVSMSTSGKYCMENLLDIEIHSRVRTPRSFRKQPVTEDT